MAHNIVKLIALLIVISVVIFGVHYLGSKIDNKSKYQHPITQPGAKW